MQNTHSCFVSLTLIMNFKVVYDKVVCTITTDCKDAIGEQWSQRTFNYMEALKGHVKFLKNSLCIP